MPKEYPDALKEVPMEKQGPAIYKLMLDGEISVVHASGLIDILSKWANVEENTELKEQLFEIQQKIGAK